VFASWAVSAALVAVAVISMICVWPWGETTIESSTRSRSQPRPMRRAARSAASWDSTSSAAVWIVRVGSPLSRTSGRLRSACRSLSIGLISSSASLW
jgi:hypothetical protein